MKRNSKERFDDMKDILDQVELKMDEKWNILSLKICKDELSEHYHYFKKIIKGYKER